MSSCGVVWCVPCGVALKTPCVDSKTPPSMCACCRHTRGRFESTHGGVFEFTHARRVLTWSQRGSPKKPVDLHHFQFENRSRTTLPDSSNHSLCLMKLLSSSYYGETLEEPAVRWFDLSFAPMKKVYRTICALVSLEASTRVSPDFAHHHHHHHRHTHTHGHAHAQTQTQTHGRTLHTRDTRDTRDT